jgi:hypothetical protein
VQLTAGLNCRRQPQGLRCVVSDGRAGQGTSAASPRFRPANGGTHGTEPSQSHCSDGFDMKPPHEFHGGWTCYLRAPGGFLVEVFHQSGVEHQGRGESFGQAGAEEELTSHAHV